MIHDQLWRCPFVCLQYCTITIYYQLSCCTFLTHLHISCSFVTLVLKLSAWCEREEREREIWGGKRAITLTPHRIFPSQALPLRCVWWLVLTLTFHRSHPNARLLAQVVCFSVWGSLTGVPADLDWTSSHKVWYPLFLRSCSHLWRNLTSAVMIFNSRFLQTMDFTYRGMEGTVWIVWAS